MKKLDKWMLIIFTIACLGTIIWVVRDMMTYDDCIVHDGDVCD